MRQSYVLKSTLLFNKGCLGEGSRYSVTYYVSAEIQGNKTDVHEVGIRRIFWSPEGCLGVIETRSHLVEELTSLWKPVFLKNLF